MAGMENSRVVVFGDELVVAAFAAQPEVSGITGFEALLTALASDGSSSGFVIWADAVSAGDVGRLVEAIRASGRRCIEVRAERWDGREPSPLSAACGGVISGFGLGGVREAVRVLFRD